MLRSVSIGLSILIFSIVCGTWLVVAIGLGEEIFLSKQLAIWASSAAGAAGAAGAVAAPCEKGFAVPFQCVSNDGNVLAAMVDKGTSCQRIHSSNPWNLPGIISS